MFWRLGVVGHPVAHSLSPQMHLAGLALAGLSGDSRRFDVDESSATSLRAMMGRDVNALSVTMPLKARAAEQCDHLDKRATELGVVNSLLWRDDQLWGSCTDGDGLVDYLRQQSVNLLHAHCAVLGSGGAARGIVASLVDAGVQSVSVLGRNLDTVQELVGCYHNVFPEALAYRPVDVIINTIPVHSRVEEATVMEGISRDTMALDITYEPRQSPWLTRYAESGCRAVNGLGMLAYQAARQMNWWWGSDIDGAELLAVIS
jgi:shikimate dehydrogenase